MRAAPTTNATEERVVNRREPPTYISYILCDSNDFTFSIFLFCLIHELLFSISAPEKRQRVPSAYNQFIK
jgi:hypothetical protein